MSVDIVVFKFYWVFFDYGNVGVVCVFMCNIKLVKFVFVWWQSYCVQIDGFVEVVSCYILDKLICFFCVDDCVFLMVIWVLIGGKYDYWWIKCQILLLVIWGDIFNVCSVYVRQLFDWMWDCVVFEW